MAKARRIEGWAIVSEDGMLAGANHVMPASLKFEADQRFFEDGLDGLDGVDVVVHGRHSHEGQPNSDRRKRLVVTRRTASLAPDPAHPNSLLWNPAGVAFDEALAALDLDAPAVGVVGAPGVFGLFLGLYDAFHLTRAPGVWLPGGVPVFPDVPARTPEEILSESGLAASDPEILDAERGLAVVHWTPPALLAR
jgi:hypothetical protein